jgi:site-specific DNA-methyltransferase (adenine-specific)
LELFVKVSSDKGDVVFDPFAGTFTTSVAAGKLGRNSVGIERNPKFIDFGKKRMKLL